MLTQKHYILLGLSIFVGLFLGLTSYGILNNNEGLYAQIGWETLNDNHWIIPHLNGLPYIEKPPLLYWILAFSFKIFGKSLFAARLVPTIFGAGTILSWIWFGCQIQKKNLGFWSAFLLSTSIGFLLFSRMVFFDIVLTFFMTAALFHFYLFYKKKSQKNLILMWVFLAGALMTKGFVALVLAGGVIGLFLIVEQKWSYFLKVLGPLGLALFLALTVPWHWLAVCENPYFTWFYFVNEHVLRFLDLRIPKDYYTGSVFYYVPRLMAYLLPWSLLLPVLFYKNLSSIFTKKTNFFEAFKTGDSLLKFLGLWFFVFFAFFSVSRAKANYYLIIAVPPLCGMLAWFVQDKLSKWIPWSVLAFNGLVIGSTIFIIPKYESLVSTQPYFKQHPYPEKFYYFRRFEELSSFLFYAPGSMPIIENASRDFWFAEQHGYGKNIFLKELPMQVGANVVVLKRDWDDFETSYGKVTEPFYEGTGYKVFKVVG
ncbi:MAG: glycosyltransferase family 39 protein [Alphaproteobacteria bacterium]